MRPSVKPPYLIALLALGLLWPERASAQCQGNFPASCTPQCGSGQVCNVTGHCVTACSSASQCGSGESCLLSQCLKYPCYGKPLAGVPERFFCGAPSQGKVYLGLPPDDCPIDFAVYDAPPPGGKPLTLQGCVWTPPTQTALHQLWLPGPIGPLEVCIGPDLVVRSFKVESEGASVTYKATVCNYGSKVAEKFRVGFWHDRAAEPAATEMGDVFKGIVSLDAAVSCPAPKLGIGNPVDVRPLTIPSCVDVLVPGGLRPNGSFKAWCRVDSGAFVEECREGNNGIDPIPYNLSNPDLQIASFEAKVSGSQVTYTTKVCNLGTADVTKFYVDVYYDRPKMPPIIGEPGDVVKPVLNLKAGDCTTLSFVRASAPKGSSICYVFADPDDFISEPNESNNLSSPVPVQVGEGGGDGGPPPSGECVDLDKDGYGVGPGCVGVPDCNDSDPSVNPGVKEVCGDKLDNDCDLTVDDGCPGVKCTDADGDGFGVGEDCVLADCDDKNKAVFPWAKETCGNNKDENCDKIADDGCSGRQCVDQDMDGYGVGPACPGPQDCNDKDFFSNPGAKEVCGDGKDNDCDGVADDACTTSVDGDGDGFPVGKPKPGYPPDCSDGDPAIYPGAKEVCGDGKDQNCNGTIDDGCPGVDCKDGDGDGWPVGKDCKGPLDCDDSDPKVHPFAEEVCGDGKDQSCNGSNDEGCTGVDCVDSDGDGWPTGKACGAKQDCNDQDGGASPWRPEICADGKDQSCDGAIDEGCPLCEDKDGDGHGIGAQCTSYDCDDGDPKSYPGAKELCDKKDNSCDGTVDEACEGGDGGGCGCELPAADAGRPLSLLGLALLVVVLLGARRRRR